MLIGITMGDACGLCPEILLRSATGNSLPHPYVLFGDLEVLEFARDKLNINLDFHSVASIDDAKPEFLNVFDCRELRQTDVTIGKISAKAGAAAVKYVQVAAKHALERRIDAIVTLPINKAASRHTFPRTELIREADYGAKALTPMDPLFPIRRKRDRRLPSPDSIHQGLGNEGRLRRRQGVHVPRPTLSCAWITSP